MPNFITVSSTRLSVLRGRSQRRPPTHLLYCAPRDCGAQLFIYRYIFAFFVIEYKEIEYKEVKYER